MLAIYASYFVLTTGAILKNYMKTDRKMKMCEIKLRQAEKT